MKALIVQGDSKVKTALVEAFARAAFEVEESSDWHFAKAKLMSFEHDVVVLESITHSGDVIDACSNYRRTGGQGVLMATGFSQPVEWEEKLLDAGFDAFIPTPCRANEVVIRANSIMRAAYKVPTRNDVLKVANISMDCGAGTVYRDQCEIHLCPMELALFEFLLRHQDQCFSSETLYQRLWNRKAGTSDTVRTHIKTLRRKIETPGNPPLIVSDRRFGYKLSARHEDNYDTTPGAH